MKQPKSEHGFLLIEALIAILIFSIGILGLVALQAMVVKATTEAQYRTEASLLTNQLIGQMLADIDATDPDNRGANLATDYASPSGGRYLAWLSEVTTTATGGLPGAAANPPTVVFGANNQVSVSVFWRQPGEASTHQHTTITQLR